MAEKVVFRGGEFDGTQVENAASEATLQLILESLHKIPGGSKKQQKLQELYNRAINEGTDAVEDNSKQVKKSSSAFESLGSAVGSISYGFGALSGAITEAASKLWSFKTGFDSYLEQFRRVSMAGVDLGESLFSTAKFAAEARMQVETFATAVSNNSVSLAALGGSATRGAQIFADIAKGMNRSGIQQKFFQLGYDIVELNEATAGYLEIQTKLGKAQRMDNRQLQHGTEQYLMQLDKLSRVTGLNRKEAEKLMRAQVNDKRLQVLMANMDETARQTLTGVLSAIEAHSPELAEGFRELVATNGVPFSDFAQSMAVQVPALKNFAMALRASTMTQDEVLEGIRREAVIRGKLTEGEEYLHATIQAQNKESPLAARAALQGLTNLGKASKEAAADQRKAMEDNQKIAAGFDQMMRNIKSTFISAFIDTKLLDSITVGISTFVKEIGSILQKMDISVYAKSVATFFEQFIKQASTFDLEKFFNDLSGLSPDKILPKISAEITAILKPLADDLKNELINALKIGLGLAIAGLFVSAVAQAALAKGISRLFGGPSGGAPSLPGSGGSPNRRLPNLGSATGETLSGIAKGIGAFANPKVALGAAAMGAAIALIGAGIAGASWIMGKTLPTLSEGVKSFESIDGEKLTAAGEGMVVMAKGIAAIAGGSLVQGLTSTLTTISESVGNFFGASNPMEKLQEFAQTDFDYEKVNKNASSLKMLGDSLHAFSNFDFNAEDGLEIIDDINPRKIERLAQSFDKLVTSAQKVSNLSFANINFEDISYENLKSLSSLSFDTANTSLKTLLDTAQKVSNLSFANLSALSFAAGPQTSFATPTNPTSSISASNMRSVELLSGIKEAITSLSEDLSVLKPADNSQIINNTRDQNHHLISLQEQIKLLNTNISELLIVQRKAHNIDRRTLVAIKQNSDYT